MPAASGMGPATHQPGAGGWRHQFGVFRRLTGASLRAYTSQRMLGWVWWIIDPLTLIAVYALIFGDLLNLRKGPEGVQYPFFLACALIPWRWFSLATRRGAGAFVSSTQMLSSTLVNRRVVVTSQAAAASLENVFGILVLVVMMIIYDRPFTMALLVLPIPLAVMGIQILALSYLLSPLFVMLPDLSNVYDVLLRLGFFLTPVLYSLERIPEQHRWWYVIVNPMVGVLEGIRRPLHDGLFPRWDALGWSALWALALLALGNWLFRRLGNDAIRML